MRRLILFLTLKIAAVALLLPLWQHAAAERQERGCLSNLKDVGTAMEMYSTDYAGRYPMVPGSRQFTDQLVPLAQLKPGYLKAVPTCPTGAPYRLTVSA